MELMSAALVFRAKRPVKILLVIFNLILISLGWVMSFYAYPRLPSRMPLWINFFGQPPINTEKSLLYFIYPLAQTLLCLMIVAVVFFKQSREKAQGRTSNPSQREKQHNIHDVQREWVLLVLIFFQLIFIHLQRSLILIAHGIEKGIRPYYFYSVFGIILLLIPYYRIRLGSLKKEWAAKTRGLF